jgi:proteasome-associated ATPase
VNSTTTGPSWGFPAFHGTREQQLEAEVRFLKARVEEMNDTPALFAVVIGITEKNVVVHTGSQVAELRKPTHHTVERGQTVRLHGNSKQIVGILDPPIAVGSVVVVKQIVDDATAEIEVPGSTKVVAYRAPAPKPGDRVVLDFTGNAIVKNLGSGDTSRTVVEETGVCWDDIGGLEEAKRALIEAIEHPHTHKELYEKFGQRAPKGVLLHGPPGNGKTMLGKAAATALALIHGASARAGGFIYCKGPDVLNKFVGESEAAVRSLFAQAREYKARTGYPAIIFIDEADALLGKRGETRWEGMERTLVPQFLAEMDGMFESGAFVILATNRPDTLDPAVIRDGRIDARVHVKQPNELEAEAIFYRALKGRGGKTAMDELATEAAEELFLPAKYPLFLATTKDGNRHRLSLDAVVSGAMIVGIVQRATQKAIRRSIAATKSQKGTLILDGLPVGQLANGDMHAAIVETYEEQRKMDHVDVLREWVATLEGVEKVERAK